jgi:hypothetical protein
MLRRSTALHEIIPILLDQVGATTENGVKQVERSRLPIAPGDHSTTRAMQAHRRDARPLAAQWPTSRPMD